MDEAELLLSVSESVSSPLLLASALAASVSLGDPVAPPSRGWWLSDGGLRTGMLCRSVVEQMHLSTLVYLFFLYNVPTKNRNKQKEGDPTCVSWALISSSISLFQPSISANLRTVTSRSPSSMWSPLRSGTLWKGPTACRFKRRRGTVERTVFTRLANGSICSVWAFLVSAW